MAYEQDSLYEQTGPGGWSVPRPSAPEPRRGLARKIAIVIGAASATAATVLAVAALARRDDGGEGDVGANLLPLGGASPPQGTTWDNADAVGCSLPLRARSRFFARREDATHQRYLDTGTQVTILEVSPDTSNGRDRKCRVRLGGGAEGWVFIGSNEVSVCPARPAGSLDGFAEPVDDDPVAAEHFGYGPRAGSADMARDCAAAYLAMDARGRAEVWAELGVRPAVPEDLDALARTVASWLEGAARGDRVAVDGFLFCRAVNSRPAAPAASPAGEAAPPPALAPPPAAPSPAGCATCGANPPVAEPAPAGLPEGYERMHGAEVVAPEATVRFGQPSGVAGLWPEGPRAAPSALPPPRRPPPGIPTIGRRATPNDDDDGF